MRFILLLLAAIILFGCAEAPLKRYSDLLEPHLGTSRRTKLDTLLGNPAFCRADGNLEWCEYRTAVCRNEQVPATFRKQEGFGPDLSPYEHYDVVHLYYDDFGILRDWRPIVLPYSN